VLLDAKVAQMQFQGAFLTCLTARRAKSGHNNPNGGRNFVSKLPLRSQLREDGARASYGLKRTVNFVPLLKGHQRLCVPAVLLGELLEENLDFRH
jgi:hypothetical protein